MRREDRFDCLIEWYTEAVFPEADWRMIKAQIATESNFRPEALSTAGCMGLMQISPNLARERLQHPEMVWCVEVNIKLGITYLKEQFDHFPEISWPMDRMCFALAAYNCGRGYVNAALGLAQWACGEHPGIKLWQTWPYTSGYLMDPRCLCAGKRPYGAMVLHYVERVMGRWRAYKDDG